MNAQLRWILLLFGATGLIFAWATPVFEGPDEVWHYAYLRYLAEQRALPALDDDVSGANQEVAQPPLYYAVAAMISGPVPDDDLPNLMWHNPHFGYQAGGTINDNKNMLIHTERERFPWRGAVLAIVLARLVSLAFGLVTVGATWGVARETFPHRPEAALAAAALAGLTPQFLFASGVVSNDTAIAALATLAVWVMARIIHQGYTTKRGLLLGLLIGLAALAKSSGLLLGGLATLALILAHLRPDGTPSRPPAIDWPSVLRHLLFAGLIAALVGGWWYARNAVRYGDPFGFQVHEDTPWGRLEPASLGTILSEAPRLYRSFWGAFGWGHVQFPAWVYAGLAILPVSALIGWGNALRTRRLPGRGRALLLATAWCALVLAALLQWMRQVEAPHGRLLFPAIGTWAVLVVGGWASLPWRRLPTLFLAGLAALSLTTPWLVIRPAFARPDLIPPGQAAETVEGQGLVFGERIRLLGIGLDQPSVSPGEWLAVRACWEGLAPMDHDYTVFVHLVGREDTRAGERYTYPGLGRFPTSLWPVGQAFCDVYRLRIERWAPVPELYDLVIGVYNGSTGERLDARYPDGTAPGLPALTQVRVAPERPLPIAPQYGRDYQVGETIGLEGYDLCGLIRSHEPLTITFYWRADGTPPGNFTAFVHLLNESGELLAQHDGPPRYGRYPTLAWQAGDIVPDEHVLQVSELPPDQPVHLVAGMYDPTTLERVPVTGPNGPMPNGLIPLTSTQ